MPLTGVNKKCSQCTHSCKQFKQLNIVFCPIFESTQKGVSDIEEGYTQTGGKQGL